jgi:hypothetical protein
MKMYYHFDQMSLKSFNFRSACSYVIPSFLNIIWCYKSWSMRNDDAIAIEWLGYFRNIFFFFYWIRKILKWWLALWKPTSVDALNQTFKSQNAPETNCFFFRKCKHQEEKKHFKNSYFCRLVQSSRF